jgi:ankyrin repeat protein
MKKIYFVCLLLIFCTAFAGSTNLGDSLIRAAFFGDAEKISSLCSDDSVDVNFQNAQGLTALIVAALYGWQDCAQLLLDEGADVDAQTYDGNTALMYACSKDFGGIVQLLIDADAQVNIQNVGCWTALMYAIAFGVDDTIVYFLCEHGADVGMTDSEGATVLDLAQTCNRDGIIDYLRFLSV